jgi:hypothetical protein
MRSLTPRGWLVLVVVALFGLWGMWEIASNLWWVGVGEPEADLWGWCWGTMTECVKL